MNSARGGSAQSQASHETPQGDARLAAPPAARFRVAPMITAVVLTYLLLRLVGSTADVFLLLFLGVIISQYLGAVADAIAKHAKLPRRFGIFIAVAGTLVGLIGLGWLLVPPVIEQTQSLVKVLPSYIQSWEGSITRLTERNPALKEFWKPGQNTLLHAVYEQVSGSLRGLVPRVFSLVDAAIKVFSVGVMGLYLALTPGVYREWMIALFPPLHRDLVRDVATDLGSTIRSYILAQLTSMFILGSLTAILLWVLDVPYWLAFGVFTGLSAVVPFFGTLVSTSVPALFVLGGEGGPFRAMLVIGVGVLVHLFEGNVVSPLLMSRRVDLPPVMTIMSVLVIGKLLGGVGLLVAVPMLAAIMVIVRRILIHRIYEGQGFRRSTRDRPMVLRVPAPDGGIINSEYSSLDLIAFGEGNEAA